MKKIIFLLLLPALSFAQTYISPNYANMADGNVTTADYHMKSKCLADNPIYIPNASIIVPRCPVITGNNNVLICADPSLFVSGSYNLIIGKSELTIKKDMSWHVDYKDSFLTNRPTLVSVLKVYECFRKTETVESRMILFDIIKKIIAENIP